jgi:hypothetical protein
MADTQNTPSPLPAWPVLALAWLLVIVSGRLALWAERLIDRAAQ